MQMVLQGMQQRLQQRAQARLVDRHGETVQANVGGQYNRRWRCCGVQKASRWKRKLDWIRWR